MEVHVHVHELRAILNNFHEYCLGEGGELRGGCRRYSNTHTHTHMPLHVIQNARESELHCLYHFIMLEKW